MFVRMDITNNATFQNSMKEQQVQIPPYTWAQKLLFHVNLPFDQSIEIRDIGWSEFVMAFQILQCLTDHFCVRILRSTKNGVRIMYHECGNIRNIIG